MRRCDLPAETCITDDICPHLGARRRPQGKGWVADCPACGGKDKLNIEVGATQRVVWTCYVGCDGATVKTAMIGRGVWPSCIPWDGRSQGREPADSARVVAEIDKLLSEQPNPVDFMIRVAALIWRTDDRAAALRAGIPRATFYRHRARFRR